MSTAVATKSPKGIDDIPENTVWIHSPILCKEHAGVLGLAVYGSQELAQLVFPNWSDRKSRKGFEIVEIPFEEAREIAKDSNDCHGNPLTAVHVHNDNPKLPSLTHWVI